MRDRYLLPLAWIIVVVLLLPGPSAGAQAQNRVALVVQRGDGSLVTRCVAFSEPYLTGYQILTRSGLDVVAAVGPLGAAICAIEGEGCEARNCFCASPPNYWSYWKLVDGEWTYAQMGANSMQVHNGAVEGWSWGPGSPPPMIAFADICAPPATPTNIPTETPQVVPTATPETPEPSVTKVDYPPPTISPSAEEAPPSPTSPFTSSEPYPVPSIDIEEEGEVTSGQDAKPSTPDDQVRSEAPPEPSPTSTRPQATVIAQAEIQPTATMSPEANAVNSLVEPTDTEAEPSARRLSGGYVIFAILTAGMVGLLVLFGRR
jgi:hypothetical protein